MFYTKQKINVKSSTEEDMIGVDYSMYIILQPRYFIEAQGYNISHNKIMQDKNSAIIKKKEWQVIQLQMDQANKY